MNKYSCIKGIASLAITLLTSLSFAEPLILNTPSMLKAAYLQLDAVGSLSSIPKTAYAAPNIIIFSFADPSKETINESYLPHIQNALNNETKGTINLLSIGGQYVTPSTINESNVQTIVNNIDNQIKIYNSKLTNGKISGVDLDLENGITEETIFQLAKGLKEKGLIVSAAPQVYLTQGSTVVDMQNPSNLVLTSGYPLSNNNTYGKAIANGKVDYLFVQTYNTGGFTIGGAAENEVPFFKNVAQALNNTVKSSCPSSGNLCIPESTKILIGEIANQGAGGNYTIFNPSASQPPVKYDQGKILDQLAGDIKAMQNDAKNFGHVAGVMMWSLNNDYMPSGWGDTYATPGAFSTKIFESAAPPVGPYFILQVTNAAPDQADQGAYASATIIINGTYYVFGNQWNQPITPKAGQNYQQWGTLASSQNPATPGVLDSSSLDTLFSNGQSPFISSQILVNGYSSNATPIGKPDVQFECALGNNYRFEAGHSYNLILNANSRFRSCDLKKIN